jgi:hypothetical protein
MNVQEEDEETKEIELLNKEIENKLKLEIKKDKIIIDSENIIKTHKWQILGDYSFHFKQNIEQIWETIKSLDSVLILNSSTHYPIEIRCDTNVWSQGNVFEGKLFDIYEFIAKVTKLKIFSELKKLEWMLDLGNENILRVKTDLYKVTEDNSTVLNMKIKYCSSFAENIILKIKEKFKENNYAENLEKIFEKDFEYLYQYESGIIPGTMEEIWDILIDYSKLASIAPNNKIFVPFNVKNFKIGDIINIPMTIRNTSEYLEIKMDTYEQKSTWNRWSFGYSILSGKPCKMLKQSLLVQLTKINKNETQLSIFTKIHEDTTKNLLKLLSKQKLYVISSFQDYFENF